MKQLFLGVLILLLATLLVPSLREKTAPHYDRFGHWAAERLEGPLSPVLNPWRRLRSQSEMGEAVRELVQHRNEGFIRPNPDDFRQYMQSQIEDEDGLDAWGSPYLLVPKEDSVSIVSAGPDLEYETDDDIVVTIRYGTPAYMPSRRRRR
jgi:hypothetical protein